MANIARDRNPMIQLKTEKKEPEVDPLTVEPLPESVMFEKKKAKKVDFIEPENNQVNDTTEIKIKEESQIPVEAPLKKEKVKKPRKKRQLSAEHLEKLRLGRLKGLETRRRRAAERKAKAQAIIAEKNAKFEAKVTKKAESEHQRTLNLAKKLKNQQVRKQYETRQVQKASSTPQDPDAEFKKFYKMMSRWEQIKIKQYQEARAKQAKAQQAKAQKARQAQKPRPKTSINSFYTGGLKRTNRFIQKQSSSNAGTNPYLSLYS